MALRVLVTRPEPGAAHTAGKLADMGFEPVLLPLTQTVPLPVALDETLRQGKRLPPPLTPPRKGEGDSEASTLSSPLRGGVRDGSMAAVAVTSANAIRHAPKELIAALAGLPCHAVGGKTARVAREAGFSAVHEGPGDAEGLAAEMAAGYPGRTVAYPCGRVRFPGFERRLAAAGIEVLPLETYDTLAVNYESEAVTERLGGRPVDAVLLYSAGAAEAVGELGRRPALAHLLGNATLLCLSGRVAAAFGAAGGKRIRVSRQPNEEALLSLLPAGDPGASSHRPFSPV